MNIILNRINNLIIRTGNSDKKLLLFFILSAILFKVLTFFYSVIDIDESTYLIIGKELLKGKILYVDYFDTKPIEIFLVFGVIDLITGNGIIFSRLLAAILVGCTAYLLYKLKQTTSGNRYASVFAGLAYLILASMYRFTYAANTEIFFVFLIILSFNIFFRENRMNRFFIGGLIAGLGFIIKYVVAFDILAYVLFLVYLMFIGRIKFVKLFQSVLLIFTGLIIPFGIVAVAYLLIGHFEDFQRFNISFLMNYHQTKEMNNYWEFILYIDLDYEIAATLEKKPKFIIFRIDPYMYNHKEYFYKNYEQVKVYNGNIFVYRRKLNTEVH